MLSHAIIEAALRDCYDPVLPCNIVDLGLLRSFAVAPDPEAPGSGVPGVPPRHRVHVITTLTSPSEETEAQLRAQIENRLAGLEAVSRTTVSFLHEPPWTPLLISTAGRRLLGLDGNPNLVQIR